jgi:hypothetical protein
VHDDAARRLGRHRQNYDFFGAPVGIILTVSRRPLQSALIVCGLALGYADPGTPAEPSAHTPRARGLPRDLLRRT